RSRSFLACVMRERKRNAVAELARRYAVVEAEHKGTSALIAERFGVEPLELADQPALAMEVDCITVAGLQPIDTHGRAAAGLLGQMARLPPLQRLGERPDARRPARRRKYQLAQRQ